MTARAAVDAMSAGIARSWRPEWDRRLDSIGLSRNELVTLASIVEAEAREAEERPVIAGVYHNRLRRGMLLQADPTVQYAIQQATGQRCCRREHVRHRRGRDRAQELERDVPALAFHPAQACDRAQDRGQPDRRFGMEERADKTAQFLRLRFVHMPSSPTAARQRHARAAEAGADELPEDMMLGALKLGHEAMQPVIELQNKMRTELGKRKFEYVPVVSDQAVEAAAAAWLGDRVRDAIAQTGGRRLMIGPGCVVPVAATDAAIGAALRATRGSARQPLRTS